MQYSEFQGLRLSRLGFGTMRLPLLPGGTDADIDEAQIAEMVRYAIEHGVNYFDTAYSYHGGQSEPVVSKILRDFPRDTWYLASKMPGHEINPHFNPRPSLKSSSAAVRWTISTSTCCTTSMSAPWRPTRTRRSALWTTCWSRRPRAASATSASPATPPPRRCGASWTATTAL